MLFHIHAHLFQDLDSETYASGQRKTSALAKKEIILNGDSVLYGAPEFADAALMMLFSQKSRHSYGTRMDSVDMRNFCEFIAHIWQVHPFMEGNTRTVATFCALYLDQLGFDVDNKPFSEHARYFRDALVRANYRNAKADIMPDLHYLMQFFENMLHGARHELKSRDLICQRLFEDPTLLRNIPASEALNRSGR